MRREGRDFIALLVFYAWVITVAIAAVLLDAHL